jgi:hypothetical protein
VDRRREAISRKSLDRCFLTIRQHRADVIELGRAVIAALLGREIANQRKRVPDPKLDWLRYLIGKSFEGGVHDVASYRERNAGLRFVTFNFDSMIEDKFHEALAQAFPEAPPDDLPVPTVHHVHGRLPAPPSLSTPIVDGLNGPTRRHGSTGSNAPRLRSMSCSIRRSIASPSSLRVTCSRSHTSSATSDSRITPTTSGDCD